MEKAQGHIGWLSITICESRRAVCRLGSILRRVCVWEQPKRTNNNDFPSANSLQSRRLPYF